MAEYNYTRELVSGKYNIYFSNEKVKLHKEIKEEVDLSVPNIRLRAGIYFDDISKFLKVFGSNQVEIIIFEEFSYDSKKVMANILKFLDVCSRTICRSEKSRLMTPRLCSTNHNVSIPLLSTSSTTRNASSMFVSL